MSSKTETVSFVLWGGPKDGTRVDVPQHTRPTLTFPSAEGVEPRVQHVYRWVSNEYRKEPRREYVYSGWQ